VRRALVARANRVGRNQRQRWSCLGGPIAGGSRRCW
jgi:hypothetical protein